MIFWLVLKLEISYRALIVWRILVSFRGLFWRLWFLHGEIFECFHNSCFALRYVFNVNGKATMWHTLYLYGHWKVSAKNTMLDIRTRSTEECGGSAANCQAPWESTFVLCGIVSYRVFFSMYSFTKEQIQSSKSEHLSIASTGL
jgi:hypothetical protein